MLNHRRTSRFRPPGFTLVEVLTVMALVVILASLTAGGVFMVVESQRQTNTENTMKAVLKVLNRQIIAVVDKAKKDPIPVNVSNLAGGDPKLARLIWIKLRLKQEFPMTFNEARAPYKDYFNNYVYFDPPNNTLLAINATDLPPISTYEKALGNTPSTPLIPPSIPNANGLKASDIVQPFWESSICLLLALKQNRGGVTLSPDELGSAAVDIDLGGNKLKYLVDGWGFPIAFFRWPSANTELDGLNPAGPKDTASKYRDKLDPLGLLQTPSWNNSTNPSVFCFEKLCHKIHDPTGSPPTTWPRSWYFFPVLASSGKNGKWGLCSSLTSGPPPGANPFTYPVDMTTDPPNQNDSNDNIYSFRLREGSRGD